MLAALVLGCSKKPDESAESAARAGSTVTLNFLCVNENYTPTIQDTVKRWEEKTGNKVDVQLYSAREFVTVLTMQMMSGGTVDIFRSDATKGAELIFPPDYFYDLSNEPWISSLDPKTKELVSFSDGTVRGLPYMSNSEFGIMYNKKIFADAGITKVPATWPEFLEACAKIKAAGIIPVNISLASGSEFCTTHLMHQLFTNVYVTRGLDGAKQLFKDLNEKKVRFADVPEIKVAMNQMIELKDKGFITDDFITNTYEMAVERFGTGKVAMHPCGDFILEPLLGAYPDIESEIGFFPAPYQNTQGTLAFCTGVGIHVANGAPNLKEALDFMAYFASEENQKIFTKDLPGFGLFTYAPAYDNAITKETSKYTPLKFTAFDEAGLLIWPEMESRALMQSLFVGEFDVDGFIKGMDEAAEIIAKGQSLPGW
jgi:ABC-type glycerol-3-phosphate transport system substrate-binding protein